MPEKKEGSLEPSTLPGVDNNSKTDLVKSKKGFNMPSSFTLLFFIIIGLAVLTWFIPAGAYNYTFDGTVISGSYHRIAQNPQGLWDILRAPFDGMIGTETTQGAIEITLFIFAIGGFLAVVTETGAVDTGIQAVIRHSKNNMSQLIWILILVFALGGSTYGMAEETIPFYTILIPLMVAVGYDALVAISIVLIGTGIGVLASTVNPFATGIASAMAGVSIADGLLLRTIMFIALYILASLFVSRYADQVKQDPANSILSKEKFHEHRQRFAVQKDLPPMTSIQKKVLVIFFVTFLIMIAGLLPWSDLINGFTFLEEIHSDLMGLPVLGNLMGQSLLPLGGWYLMEITVLFFLSSIIIGFISKMGEQRFVEVFIDGTKDLLDVVLIVTVARGIQVIMNNGQITATILFWGEKVLTGLSEGMFITFTYLFYIPMSFLIPSTSGLAAATMGIMAPLGQFAGVAESLVVTAYQSAAGLVNLITPTSGVVMGALAIAGIPITSWWKYIWKLLAAIIVVTIALLVISTWIG